MSWITVAASVLLGLAINEIFDVSPWIARRVVLLAARVWTREPDQQATYAEEWQAIIAERPGKVSKVLTAAGFLGVGLAVRTWNHVEDWTVLSWLSLIPVRRLNASLRHVAPPRSVPREKLPRRLSQLMLALWAGKDTPTAIKIATKLAAHSHCPQERSQALLIVAIGSFNTGREQELANALERANQTLQETHSPRLAAQIQILSAMVAARQGQHASSLVTLSSALSHLITAERTYETAFAWHDFATVCSYLSLHEQAIDALQRAVALGQDLGISDGHLINPGIHLRRALWYDHRGDVSRCARQLGRLVEDYDRHSAAGTIDQLRDTALAAYGYAMARLAALDGRPREHAERLLSAHASSKSGQDMRTLGMACLAIAAGRPQVALAALDPDAALTRLGAGEPHRVRALALWASGDLGAARVAELRSRDAALAEHAPVSRLTE